MDGGVLGENRDAALALELVRVHDPLGDPLVGAEDAALVEQGVDQRRLAMIDVGDDGDVAPERVGDLLRRRTWVKTSHQYIGYWLTSEIPEHGRRGPDPARRLRISEPVTTAP